MWIGFMTEEYTMTHASLTLLQSIDSIHPMVENK